LRTVPKKELDQVKQRADGRSVGEAIRDAVLSTEGMERPDRVTKKELMKISQRAACRKRGNGKTPQKIKRIVQRKTTSCKMRLVNSNARPLARFLFLGKFLKKIIRN
jgi:hypothetical protein